MKTRFFCAGRHLHPIDPASWRSTKDNLCIATPHLVFDAQYDADHRRRYRGSSQVFVKHIVRITTAATAYPADH
jgi:hypothetical protein